MNGIFQEYIRKVDDLLKLICRTYNEQNLLSALAKSVMLKN